MPDRALGARPVVDRGDRERHVAARADRDQRGVGGSSFSPSAADSCGATTMIPSADWARSRSTPSPMERRFSELRLTMLTV